MWLGKKLKHLDETIADLKTENDHKRAEVEDVEIQLRKRVAAVLSGITIAEGLDDIGHKLSDFRRGGR
jgi:hypothetical protein